MFLRFIARAWPFLVVGNVIIAVVDLLTGNFLGAAIDCFLAFLLYELGGWLGLISKLDSK